MTLISQLPPRPLRPNDIAALDEDERLNIVPYGGIPEGDAIRVYAIKLAAGGTAHALGFDDSNSQWRQLTSADGSDLAAADDRLDSVLDDWVQDRYGGRFEVHKTV